MGGRFSFLGSVTRKLNRAQRLQEQGEAVKAFALWAELAKTGVAEAAYKVGQCYLAGRGTPSSLEEGARWTYRAAKEGFTEAYFTLATIYAMGVPQGFDPSTPPGQGTDVQSLFHEGDVVERQPDLTQAYYWAQKGAEIGHVGAAALLGHILHHGPAEIRDIAQARRWYEAAIEGGSAQGSLGLGLILIDDGKDEAERARGETLLLRAAEQGLATACAAVGWLYERGMGGQPPDVQKAAFFYQKAAEQNIPSAQARYGLMLLKGVGVEPNLVRAESLLRSAARFGDVEAAALLGDLYIRGKEFLHRPEEAAQWYHIAAQQNHTPSARVLGVLYLTGTGVLRDAQKAAYWFSVAATLGNHQADADLGNLVLAGVPRPEEERHALKQRFEAQAEKGDLLGAFNLGVCLAQGLGGSPDATKALYWLGLAREGIVNAQYWYGRMLFEGRGIAADRRYGLIWMDKAARQGMPEACVSVAQLLVSGAVGGIRDHARALELYHQAAEAGNTDAFFSLGAMYGGGHDTPTDLVRAREYFEEAAQRGHALGQMMLGRYLLKGLGGPKHAEEARLWLEQAAEKGVEQAREILAAFGEDMTEAQHTGDRQS